MDSSEVPSCFSFARRRRPSRLPPIQTSQPYVLDIAHSPAFAPTNSPSPEIVRLSGSQSPFILVEKDLPFEQDPFRGPFLPFADTHPLPSSSTSTPRTRVSHHEDDLPFLRSIIAGTERGRRQSMTPPLGSAARALVSVNAVRWVFTLDKHFKGVALLREIANPVAQSVRILPIHTTIIQKIMGASPKFRICFETISCGVF
ncbi:hypothetical protein BOTBODRAFT_35555 [Botryobasidium botryosum FD-172 SS1]|uniref:Uncharacterized protein n=1 Tax=Botryobasidium botryosum (strain FD-172 SS1) TaxID=930990 RepID=A0A067MI68_BOTB1|nr:hypothetical protein BOTBODRAFT_35555 [Botryobasidium botryosum FD-172 SS1]